MPRAVLDPNVLIAALISPRGAPSALYLALARGDFELVVSPLLLAELDRVLTRTKFRRYASLEQAQAFVGAVARLAVIVDDPPRTAGLTADPDDDYLVSLASVASVDALVSGDRHLLTPIQPPTGAHGARVPRSVRHQDCAEAGRLTSREWCRRGPD